MKRFLNWLLSKTPAYRAIKEQADRDRDLVHVYAAALRDIVITGDNVKVPNGTTRRMARLANQAFADGSKVVVAAARFA